MRKRLLSLGVLACGLTACAGGEVYPMSVSRVEHRLRDMAMPAELGFGSYGNDAIVEGSSDRAVTWRLTEHDVVVGWVDAKLDPVDLDHTRVEVKFRPGDALSARGEAQKNFMGAVGTAVLGEAVDAELDGRPYNKARAQTQVAAYALTHRDEYVAFAGSERMAALESRDSMISQVSARDPRVGVALREDETQRQMKAASEPSLKLGEDD